MQPWYLTIWCRKIYGLPNPPHQKCQPIILNTVLNVYMSLTWHLVLQKLYVLITWKLTLWALPKRWEYCLSRAKFMFSTNTLFHFAAHFSVASEWILKGQGNHCHNMISHLLSPCLASDVQTLATKWIVCINSFNLPNNPISPVSSYHHPP